MPKAGCGIRPAPDTSAYRDRLTTLRVFVSAVSSELAPYRAEVARVLRRKGLEVRDQDHFRQGTATLLEQLRDYIQHCDAVILLIGNCSGYLATADPDAVWTDYDRLHERHFVTGRGPLVVE